MTITAVMEPSILWFMFIMTFGLWICGFATIFVRVRNIILLREADTTWVKEVVVRDR